MPFERRYRYRFGDIDDSGVAYYPSFFHYFHSFFEDWWSEGLGVEYARVLHDEKLAFPVVRAECDFLRPVRYGDEPKFSLGILDIGTSSVRFGYWLRSSSDDALLCRARITTAATDMAAMRSVPLPDYWRQRFADFVVAPGEYPADEGKVG